MYNDHRIYIENPPPFKSRGTDRRGQPIDIAIDEGLETARQYLAAGVRFAGFHHSDLDIFEAAQLNTKKGADRYATFDYARLVHTTLADRHLITAPHRIVVYDPLDSLEADFRGLAASGIRNVVLVGKPQDQPPAGAVYRNSVEQVLAHMAALQPALDIEFGVIGIHTRPSEAERIADKFEAAGGHLRVMTQFIDDADTMTCFMRTLARVFDQRRLDLAQLELNVGLAVFALADRGFYARLLRKDSLACERRLKDKTTTLQRIEASNGMNLEFAARIKESAGHLGMDAGFSIQPIIERYLSGELHPAVFGAADLAKRLEQLYIPQPQAA